MIFVDTSIWVDFFRGRTPEVAKALDALLEADQAALAAPVRIELVSGLPKQRAARIAALLAALPAFKPSDGAWETMETWGLESARRGEHFGVADLIIGAIAAEHSAPVWSHDQDFERMAVMGFVSTWEP